MADWIGKVRGHVAEAKRLQEQHRAERERAEKAERSVILTKNDVQGDFDAGRVLFTTLGGKLRPLTVSDLAAFRRNMNTARQVLGGRVDGITAKQVIDLSSSNPLRYKNPDIENAASDLEKARKEIHFAQALSASNGLIRFVTNASKDSKGSRHHVTVDLLAFGQAVSKLAAYETGDKKGIKTVARWLRDQKLAFECDCGRHRYYFRYVATVGGFSHGRAEWGFPKINNPDMRGVACKHVIRVMSELKSSSVMLDFLARHLTKVQASPKSKASMQVTQKDAEAAAETAKKRQILTTDQRNERNQRERQKRAVAAASKSAKRLPEKSRPARQKALERTIAGVAAGNAAQVAAFRAAMQGFGVSKDLIEKAIKEMQK